MQPCCAICTASYEDYAYESFTLVYFRAIAPPSGREGQPENARWFCKDHVRYTKGMTDMSAILAMVHIRAAIRRNPPSTWPLTSMP
ncbi:hypothetical protein PL81_12400 [Streptomyces sp. RSD-27]|nr:hypothetical protein PL81_12400 [Streptomyces sp. RSD-27]